MGRALGKILGLGLRMAAALGFVVVVLLVVLTQTPLGREWVLREVLDRVGRGIRGEIEIVAISSPGLIKGFTFHGVTIRGEDGRTFLMADSVRAGISAPALLRGDLIFTGVHLWEPELTLERLPGQARMNVERIFLGPSDSDADTLQASTSAPPAFPDSDSLALDSLQPGVLGEKRGETRTILLRDAYVHDGSLDLLLPLSPGQAQEEGILVARGPEGNPVFRRMSFRELNLVLGQAVLRSPAQEGERFEIRDMAFLGEVWPAPFRITNLRGELRREGRRLVGVLDELKLADSEMEGRLDVRWGGAGGIRVLAEAEAGGLSMEDIAFIDDRLPSGTARGPFTLELSDRGVLLGFQGTQLTSPLGDLAARGSLFLGEEMAFDDLDLTLTDLDLAVTDPWVQDTLPLRGRMTGELSLAGTLDQLAIQGLVDFTDPDSVGSMTADIRGRIGLTDGFSASSLQLTLAPMDWGVLASVSPEMKLRGPGAVRMILTGSLTGDGLGIDGELTHFPGGRSGAQRLMAAGASVGSSGESVGSASRVTLVGRVRQDSTDLYLNLSGDLSPLSLTTIGRSYPGLPVQGEYNGRVDARGGLSDLEMIADLETSGGPIQLTTRFDARRLEEGYRIEARADDGIVLSQLLPSMPDPTRLSGHITFQGRGLDLDALGGTGQAHLRGDLGPLRVDSAALSGRIERGVLQVEELTAETEAGEVSGVGAFGVASWAPPGDLTLEIRSESLEPLRPFVMEEPRLIRDELTGLQRDILRLEGVDPDTLPTAEEVAMGGSLEGTVTLSGGFSDFSANGDLTFRDLRFRSDYLEAGEMSFSVPGLPSLDGRMQAQVRTDSVSFRFLDFSAGTADVELGKSGGNVRITANRSSAEAYSVRGTYAVDSVGSGIVNLDDMTLRFDTIRWNLGGPASVSWNPEGFRIRDFQLIRPGTETMRVRVHGFYPRPEGPEGDLLVEVQRLNLDRLARVVQIETPFQGLVNFSGRIKGVAESPAIVGIASGRDFRYGDFLLGDLESDFQYENQRLYVDLTTYDGGEEVLTGKGFVPVDLRLVPEGSRIPEGPVDLSMVLDSFPAAVALGFMDSLEEIEGTLTGNLHFGGTSADLESDGVLALSDGSVLIPALGVRHRDVQAELTVREDGVVEVAGTSRAGGTARVSGTVTLTDPLSDPELDLRLEARELLAVSRRDVQARLSGALEVTKRYRQPRVTGTLTVQEGVLMVEEVARSVEVVDLSNPAFFDVVDTTLVTLRPIIQASQNPFLQNLQLDVDLTMAQDSWLRGRDLNVEMAGTLDVYWDRMERDMTFLGVLDAVRGVYSVLGRQFQIEEGTVSFAGTPGINPDLDIRALNRVRTPDNQPLDIVATVGGSLLEPRVSLSTNSTFAISESDLVSYLIFGQPSYALASGEGAIARGTAQVFAGATANLAAGLFSSELGSVLARDGLPVNLDYLAITQGKNDPGGLQDWWMSTQVELGKYLTDDIFAGLQFRPFTENQGQDRLASVRLETRLSDRWTLEGYWEDRFLRRGLYGLRDQNLYDKVLGFLLYTEWGY